MLTTARLPEKQRPVIRHAELDSSPVNLRVNLEVLDDLLEGCDTWLAQRVLLASAPSSRNGNDCSRRARSS